MPRHRAPVVRDHNPSLLGCEFEKRWVLRSLQPGRLHIQDVDGGFAGAKTLDNAGFEIFIRQEADAHVRFKPICRRAASRRANSSGACWLNGGTDR